MNGCRTAKSLTWVKPNNINSIPAKTHARLQRRERSMKCTCFRIGTWSSLFPSQIHQRWIFTESVLSLRKANFTVLGVYPLTFLYNVDLPLQHPISVLRTFLHMFFSRPNGIMVYNCASGDINGHTWGEVTKYSVLSARKTPASNVLWYPAMSLQRSK